MSLEAREERILNSIADDLAASAPELASRLSVFNLLTCGERMPEEWMRTTRGRNESSSRVSLTRGHGRRFR